TGGGSSACKSYCSGCDGPELYIPPNRSFVPPYFSRIGHPLVPEMTEHDASSLGRLAPKFASALVVAAPAYLRVLRRSVHPETDRRSSPAVVLRAAPGGRTGVSCGLGRGA